jgi:uncharacterized protein YdhG (YjbR/CyaY superfamily)
MSGFADHDAYIAAAPEEQRPLLRHLRTVLSRALPGIPEIIRYDMPGFGQGSAVVAGYAAFSRQCGLYVQKAAIAALEGDIAAAGLKTTKTGITFSAKKPLPDDLVIALAQASRRELGL